MSDPYPPNWDEYEDSGWPEVLLVALFVVVSIPAFIVLAFKKAIDRRKNMGCNETPI